MIKVRRVRGSQGFFEQLFSQFWCGGPVGEPNVKETLGQFKILDLAYECAAVKEFGTVIWNIQAR